ncbi:hypothetical protein [Hyphomonas sp.]|uniref:hypothetical protein n=1 Tax=Hyphomonas sp. TaxID=87 RepID=UPI003919173E
MSIVEEFLLSTSSGDKRGRKTTAEPSSANNPTDEELLALNLETSGEVVARRLVQVCGKYKSGLPVARLGLFARTVAGYLVDARMVKIKQINGSERLLLR